MSTSADGQRSLPEIHTDSLDAVIFDLDVVLTGHRRPPFVEASRTPTMMSAAVAGPTTSPSDALLHQP